MDVSFDGISDDDLALIWKVLRDKVEAANDAGDDDEREACHLALMSACAETGRRTEAWIAEHKVED